MSGTIPLSLTQQFDEFGKPLSGGKLYIIQAGTVATPQDSFQDPALSPSLKLPNPITLDAAGRLPQFFLADGFIKIRLTDAAGIIQREADGIQVIGPSGGGGGGGAAVDPNALVQTGNMIMRYGLGALAGYVRMNGFTMGNATSGATERANADTQALWIYLYGIDASLAVSGGRTGNALNDYNASKTIGLPDWQGCVIGGLDDMRSVNGSSPAGRLTAAFFGVNPTALGAFGGSQSHALTAAELAPHPHAFNGTTGDDTPDHTHAFTPPALGAGTGTSPNYFYSNTGSGQTGGASTRHKHPFSGFTDTGSGVMGTPHTVVQPTKLCTIYMKL